MSNIVPFGYSFQSNSLPAPIQVIPLPSGQNQAVHITCTEESQQFLLDTFNNWFESWQHVILVNSGISEKQETAFIVLEWEESYIDQLFLQILQSEDSVLDFSVYIHDSEV